MRVGVDADLVVVGAEALGDEVGVVELVALLAADGLEADGEGLQAVLARLGEQRRRSGWSRARPTAARRPARRRPCGARRRCAATSSTASCQSRRSSRRARRARLEVGLPVACVVVRVPSGSMAQDRAPAAACATPRRMVRGAGTTEWKRQVVVQRDRVDAGVDAAAGQQRRQRRGEAQPRRASSRQVQRLDAEPVAAEHHPAAVALGDREGEHAVEALDERGRPSRW